MEESGRSQILKGVLFIKKLTKQVGVPKMDSTI
jgi:hypothetical protein